MHYTMGPGLHLPILASGWVVDMLKYVVSPLHQQLSRIGNELVRNATVSLLIYNVTSG